MNIKIIELGVPYYKPDRKHADDLGADVYNPGKEVIIEKGACARVNLGFGIDVPRGYSAIVAPTTGMTKKGLLVISPPIDPGYTGEIGAYILNMGAYPVTIEKGDKVGQITVASAVLPTFVTESDEVRGKGKEGSTGTTGKILVTPGRK